MISRRRKIASLGKAKAFPPGEVPANPQVGDLLLTASPSPLGALIRFGQRLRYWRSDDRPFAWFNHVAVVVGENLIAEALAEGIVLRDIRKYKPEWFAYVAIDATDRERDNIGRFALRAVEVQTGYGFFQFVGIGLALFFGTSLRFASSGTMICSAFAASCLRAAGYWFEHGGRILPDPWVVPADIAVAFRTELLRGQ